MNFCDYMQEAAEKYGLSLTDKMLSQFESYYKLLIEWNGKINLTAITKPDEVAVKHFIDSLSCYDEKIFLPGAAVIDVGTGAGFPGIPLKICHPELKLTLLDSLHKRVKFLQEIVDALELTETACICGRAEDMGSNLDYREKYDIAVSRAVAALPVLAEYCMPFVKKGGYFIALKGMKYEEEMTAGQNAIKKLGGKSCEAVPIKLPNIEDKRAVLYIKKCSATPKLYPRKAGAPRKNPL